MIHFGNTYISLQSIARIEVNRTTNETITFWLFDGGRVVIDKFEDIKKTEAWLSQMKPLELRDTYGVQYAPSTHEHS